MHTLFQPGRLLKHIRASGVVLFTLYFLPNLAYAQINNENQEKYNERRIALGGYFSLKGIDKSFCIYGACDPTDSMPYPRFHGSIRYNQYQITSFWAKDENEFLYNFNFRYNYYLLDKSKVNIVSFIGPGIWYFNKTSSLYDVGIDDNLIEIETDRPHGKKLMPNLALGIGMAYNFGILTISHEIDFTSTRCSYEDFICGSNFDIKIVGLHLNFNF